MFAPKRFFAVSGSATGASEDIAFDNALVKAGLDNVSLLPVTSILPANSVEVPKERLEDGMIQPVIMAMCSGEGGERIVAGIAWVRCKRLILVNEFHGKGVSRADAKAALDEKLDEMVRVRSENEIEERRYVIEELLVPSGTCGCAVAALVLLP